MERELRITRSAKSIIALGEEFRIEILRKAIHLSIAVVPTLVSLFGIRPTLLLLASGTLFYTGCETLRMSGIEVPMISQVTALAARKRDAGKYVMGPITLGLGAMLALLLYPDPAASAAIYALAFGDGLSSLVGKLFGSIRLPMTGGKSLEGSLTCFMAVLVTAYGLSHKFIPAVALALFATIIEAIPLKDLDNIVLPVLTGALAYFVL